MKDSTRITCDSKVMGGKPCIRGMRVTVGTIFGLIASGHSFEEILKAYPYLEEKDLREALNYSRREVTQHSKNLRPFGFSANDFVVPEDFDVPLPDEILNDFEN